MKRIVVNTKGMTDIIDITSDVQEIVSSSGAKDGVVHVFVQGSTAAVTTMEYEPNLKKDIEIVLNKLIPYGHEYEHHKTWGDDNGASHIRSAVVGTSLTVPFENGKLLLGTWQQIVLIDFDTRPRKREVMVSVINSL